MIYIFQLILLVWGVAGVIMVGMVRVMPSMVVALVLTSLAVLICPCYFRSESQQLNKQLLKNASGVWCHSYSVFILVCSVYGALLKNLKGVQKTSKVI